MFSFSVSPCLCDELVSDHHAVPAILLNIAAMVVTGMRNLVINQQIHTLINYFSYTRLKDIDMEPEERYLKRRKEKTGYRPVTGDESVLIRRLRAGDFEAVLEIDRDVFGGYDPSIFTAFYEYHPTTTLIAESNDRVVGFVLGFKHTPLEGRIFWLAVHPSYQSRGVGTKLLIAILGIFRRMGAVSATLEVRVSNKRAQSLYSIMGFKMTSIYPSYYSDGEAAIIMKKPL